MFDIFEIHIVLIKSLTKRELYAKDSGFQCLLLIISYTENIFYEIPGFFDQTFQGLGLGKLFLARESLVSDIPAGNGNIASLFFTV